MKVLSYNKEVLTATGEMIRLFSNISIIQLHDKNGNAVKPANSKKISVPLKYAQTSRILKSIMNPKGEPPEYPLITLEKKDMVYDLSRNTEIHHDMATLVGKYDPNTHPPIPMNIDFTINIFAKYPEDVDMIISNFAPWFNTDVYVTSPHPKLSGKYINHQVLWDGNIHYEWKSSLQSGEQDIITASTNFTFKTELYAGYGKLKDDDDGVIHRVIFDYSVSDGTNYPSYDENERANCGNAASGFFCVPYSTDFDTYSEQIISNTISASELDYDSVVFNKSNEQFNSAVIDNDLNGMIKAVSEGADIHLHSYWPYAYAKSNGYDDIVEWLDNNNSLKPNVEHYPPPSNENIEIADTL